MRKVPLDKIMTAEQLQLLIDLHKGSERLGPGGYEQTELALNLAAVDREMPISIADIGCGTGASTLTLARLTGAHITAVDFIQDFLDVLVNRAQVERLADRINPLCCSMDDLPFRSPEFDVLWSEGAIYNIGFAKGIEEWRRFLKPNGLLVVSEISWTTGTRPGEIQSYWEHEYPEIATPSEKLRLLESTGYSPLSYFVLPDNCWMENYYAPLQTRF